MADANTNPYLALLQQEDKPPSLAQILQHVANLGFGMAGGLGQAASQGGSTMGGIGSGLLLGNQINAQQAQRAEQERMKRLEWQFKAQEHEDKRAEMRRNQAAIDAYVKMPGFQVAPQQGPLMGPGGSTSGPAAPAPDQASFVAMMMPHALEVSKATGLDPRLVIAQSALETGYGRAAPGNNYFGIKSHGRPGGQTLPTNEVGPGGEQYTLNQSFRTYGDPGASAKDYADFIKTNSRYAPVLAAQGLDAQIEALGKSGYATDPNYAAKLRQIAQRVPGGPQVAQGPVTAGGSPIDLNAQPPPFMGGPTATPAPVLPQGGSDEVTPLQYALPPAAAPAPGTPSGPGGPNVVQAQYAQTPATPPMAPPPRLRALPPELEARINSLVGLPRGVGLTIAQAEKMKEDARAAQYQGDLKAWEVGQQRATEERKLEAQKAAEQRKLETELVPMRDRATGEVKAVTKAEALRGAQSGQFIPLEASKEAREEAAAALAKATAERAAANQDVLIDPVTGQRTLNPEAIGAKEAISRAQGTDPSSKITLELAQDAIKRNSEWQKAGAAAGGTIRNLDIFTKLSEQVKTGKYAGSVADLKATLKSAGVNLEAWGIPNNVGPAQAMQMMSQRFALEMRQEMPGPMSDGDRKFMEKGAISIENDPGANKIMAAWLKGNAEKAQDRAKFAREYMRSADFKADPAGIDDYVEQKLAGKDYFDHSVLPSETPATGKTPWELEIERRGNMNSAKPG